MFQEVDDVQFKYLDKSNPSLSGVLLLSDLLLPIAFFSPPLGGIRYMYASIYYATVLIPFLILGWAKNRNQVKEKSQVKDDFIGSVVIIVLFAILFAVDFLLPQ